MRNGLLFLLGLVLILSVLPFRAASADDKIVATVGDAIITSSALEELLSKYVPLGGFHGAVQPAQKDKYRKKALNELIEIELLYKEAQKRKMAVPEKVVSEIVDENVRRYGSKEKFDAELKREGMTLEMLRGRIKKTQMVLGLLKGLYQGVGMTDADLRAYYEKQIHSFKRPEAMHLYHILVKVGPADPESVWQQKKKHAEEILAKIRAGEDFGDAAYKYSEDPYRAKYGDLGLVHKGQLTPPELEEAAFALKEGQVSDVIRTIYGFHILKAGEKKPPQTIPFKDVKDRLKKELEQKKYDAARDALIKRLRAEYPVKILIALPAEAAEGETGPKAGH